jgi:hypothetical protein
LKLSGALERAFEFGLAKVEPATLADDRNMALLREPINLSPGKTGERGRI